MNVVIPGLTRKLSPYRHSGAGRSLVTPDTGLRRYDGVVQKFCLAGLITGCLIVSTAHAADPFTLATKACNEEDTFVRHAILDYVKELYPKQSVEIDRFHANGCQHPQTTPPPAVGAAPTEETTLAEEALAKAASLLDWSSEPFDGEIEANGIWETGDTETRDLMAKATLHHNYGRLRNTLEASAQNQRENDVTLEEEYRLKLRSDYKLTERWFAFGELGYIDDRFSGFDYRLSELLGLGYILYDQDDFYWETRAGFGARQDKLVDGDSENSILFDWRHDLEWQFYEGWTLGEKAGVAISGNSDIYESETYLTSKITDTLALKASYYIEYIDGAPEGTEATDTRTSVGVVYGF